MNKKITAFLICLATFAATAQTKIYDVAGNKNLGAGYSGDDSLAVAAKLDGPSAITFDASGNLYIADSQNGCIRMVNTAGIITTVVGNYSLGTGYSGDGAQATDAQLSSNITSLVFDGDGNLYIGDLGNVAIRKVNTAGVISSYYGPNGSTIFLAAGVPCTGLAWSANTAIYGAQGGLLVATQSGPQSQITAILLCCNSVSSTWGGATSNNLGDGSSVNSGASVGFNKPSGMTFDHSGNNLYIADANNNRIRVVNMSNPTDPSTWIINNFAGNASGTSGTSGDGGQATAAKLTQPNSICFDAAGNLYIADTYNNRIRKVTTAGIITTIANSTGNSTTFGYNGDAVTATTALLSSPQAVTCDASGSVYVADYNNNEIREITSTCVTPTIISPLVLAYESIVCINGSYASLQLNAVNATGYQWQVNKGTVFTNSAGGFSPNTNQDTTGTVYANMNGWKYRCIVKGCKNDTSNIFTLIISQPTITVTNAFACPGNTTSTLTASGATTYTWNTTDTGNVIVQTPTVTTNYTVTGTDTTTKCTASAIGTINVIQPQVPTICMVTTDTSFTNNIVYWDKTLYTKVDSFIVYRYDVTSASYLKLGAVGKDSSQFTDIHRNIGGPNGGDPNVTSWQYKIAILDSCGSIGTKSPYHQTVNIQQNNQNITWNAYTIEGQSNPVSGYQVLRDSLGIADWHVFVNTSGLSTNDNSFSSFPNANYRVDALGFACNPTLRLASGNNNTDAAKIKSHSNQNNNRQHSTGIKQVSGNQISIYPNPATNILNIGFATSTTKASVKITSLLGSEVLGFNQTISGNNVTIDINTLASGTYLVHITTDNVSEIKKIVKQ